MDLLNPHLLTQNELIKILSDRNLNINDLNKKSQIELLEMYYNFIMPLHQRNSHQRTNGGMAMGREDAAKNGFARLNSGSSNHRLKNKALDGDGLPCNGNVNKHKRIEFSKSELGSSGEPEKKIRVMANGNRSNEAAAGDARVALKRAADSSIDSQSSASKHKKITWP